jgi:hypothetical protein
MDRSRVGSVRGMRVLPRRGSIWIATAAAVLAVTAAGTAVALTTSTPATSTPARSTPARSTPSGVALLAASGRTSAALKVTGGTPVLQVSMARLGRTLLRVSAPDGSQPALSGSAPVVLSITGAPARGPVRVVLNSSVTWSLDFAGGTQLTEADLRGGKVRGIAVTAGSSILDLTLPRPSGTLPFLLAGGVSQFRLSLPAGVPARVTVGGGASQVSMGSQDLTGVAGGTVISPPGWTGAADRFDIDATSGFSRLTVTRWS